MRKSSFPFRVELYAFFRCSRKRFVPALALLSNEGSSLFLGHISLLFILILKLVLVFFFVIVADLHAWALFAQWAAFLALLSGTHSHVISHVFQVVGLFIRAILCFLIREPL